MAKTQPTHRNHPYRTNPGAYRVNGSAAYQPDFDGSAVRSPQRKPAPQARPRRQPVRRPRVELRPADAFSPLALVGMLAIVACAALFLVANARLMVVNDQIAGQLKELETLQKEYASLLARRELLYDLDKIETELLTSGKMVKPQAGQITRLNVSSGDNVVLFREEERLLDALYEKLLNFFRSLAA